MSNKKVALAASAALAASSLFLVVQPASGALVTTCTGDAGAVTVPGDLVVPRGQACFLQGTTVTGNVRVESNADLLLEGASVGGEVYVNRNGYLETTAGSTVAGQVYGRDAAGVYAEESALGGLLRSTSPNNVQPFVYLYASSVAGGLDSTATGVTVESSQVDGPVSARNGEYADVIDSVLTGTLSVRNNSSGAVVCESEIYGDAVYRDNKETLQIGGAGAVGPCDGASFWGGNVTFTNNTAGETGFDLSNNIVAGNLAGSGNNPLPTGSGNRVRGEITLQFAEAEVATESMEKQSARSAEIQAEASAVVDARTAEVLTAVDQRRAVATERAATVPAAKALSPAPTS